MSTINFHSATPQHHLNTIRGLLQSVASSSSVRSLFGVHEPSSLRPLYAHHTFDLLLGPDGQPHQSPQPRGTGYQLVNRDGNSVATVYLDNKGSFLSLEFASLFTQLTEHAKQIAAVSVGLEDDHELSLLHVPELQLVAIVLVSREGKLLVCPLNAAETMRQKLYTMSEFRLALQAPLQQRLAHPGSYRP